MKLDFLNEKFGFQLSGGSAAKSIHKGALSLGMDFDDLRFGGTVRVEFWRTDGLWTTVACEEKLFVDALTRLLSNSPKSTILTPKSHRHQRRAHSKFDTT